MVIKTIIMEVIAIICYDIHLTPIKINTFLIIDEKHIFLTTKKI